MVLKLDQIKVGDTVRHKHGGHPNAAIHEAKVLKVIDGGRKFVCECDHRKRTTTESVPSNEVLGVRHAPPESAKPSAKKKKRRKAS